MTTGELIKMLQEADPSGKMHIRTPDGMPWFVEPKAGYWDGAYSYLDENKNYVVSTEGSKVDLRCMSLEDFVENHFNYHKENNWDDIKSKFIFKLTYSIPEQKQERIDGYLKRAKETYDEQYAFHKEYYQKSILQAVERAKKGWHFFQDKKVETARPNYFYYGWKIEEPSKPETSSSVHDTEGILWSGNFERLDNNEREGYYEWKLKN